MVMLRVGPIRTFIFGSWIRCPMRGSYTQKTRRRLCMEFEKHLELEGQHAFLSPSQFHWINYDADKLRTRYLNSLVSERGTRLHAYAHDAIELGRIQPRNKDTVNMFINDAIGFKMQSEQPLFYSWNCFGTADAISYRKNILRISDLKTGLSEAHMEQLRVYAALFCLEYQRIVRKLRKDGIGDGDIADKLKLHPKEIHFDPMQMNSIILRIYQLNEITEEIADPGEIAALMDIIVADNEILREVKAEE